MADVSAKMNDFARQWDDTGGAVEHAVRGVGRSGRYILGPHVARFERAVAALAGRRAAVGCASGMDAIELALRALGMRAGDRVLTTPLSAFATTLAIVRGGGVPVFVDTDERGLVDLDGAEQAIEKDRSIRFFVPVHLYGFPIDLDRLAALRIRFDLRVVEDCAQAIGAAWKGRPAGTTGDAAALSFYPTKNLGALGDAGAVLTDDPAVEHKLRALRDYGQTGKYVHTMIGLNSRLDEVQAAILEQAFLPRFAQWTQRRRTVAQLYGGRLAHPEVSPVSPGGEGSVWHLFPVRVPAPMRSHFRRFLAGRGVETAEHYPVLIPNQPAMQEVAWERRGELEHAARLAGEEVSLPLHPYLSDAEVEHVAASVNSWRPSS